eukprot:1116166_1
MHTLLDFGHCYTSLIFHNFIYILNHTVYTPQTDKNYTDTIDYNAVAPNGSHPTGPNNIVGRDAHSQSTCYCSHHHSNDIAVQTLHSKRLQRYQYLSTSKTSLHSQPTDYLQCNCYPQCNWYLRYMHSFIIVQYQYSKTYYDSLQTLLHLRESNVSVPNHVVPYNNIHQNQSLSQISRNGNIMYGIFTSSFCVE